VKDEQWGLRLHQADLAVNKILVASSRKKARDFADIVAITASMCPLGPLVMAAAGKPPGYSPQKIIEQIREVTADTIKTAVLRKATDEPDVMPVPVEFGTTQWGQPGT
jgi:hypothetical protein